MKEALKKVRMALSNKDIVLQFTQYSIHNSMIHAYDGRFCAAAPIEETRDLLVPGRELERLLDRLPSDEPEITVGAQEVTIRAGRMHGTIRLLTDREIKYPTPGPVWTAPPEEFIDSLRRIRPFVSDNAVHSWALCVSLEPDVMRATTNVSLAEVVCLGLDAAGHLLPCWAIDYILSRNEELLGIQIYPDYAAFKWDDGTWMRTQLVVGEFPKTARDMFKTFEEPTWKIPGDWRAAYQTVAELAESEVEIHAEKIVGKQGAATTEFAVDSVMPEDKVAKFDPRFLNAVVASAERWQPDKWPNATPFAAEGLRGFVVGRR